MSESSTLLNRTEAPGRRYPLFIERGLLVLVFLGVWLLHSDVQSAVGGVLGSVAAWCGLPLLLLMCAEIIGRVIQSMRNDS